MQISVILKKLEYIGIDINESRIKICNEKPVNKEDVFNLTKQQIEEEHYYKSCIKPKVEEPFNRVNVNSIKYTIFKGRNGRNLLIRKPYGGDYSKIDSKTRLDFCRIDPDRSYKRFKVSESKDNLKENLINPNINNEIINQYEDFNDFDNCDINSQDSDDENKTAVDDYTAGFISRYRKRKASTFKKRPNQGVSNSFKLSTYSTLM